jgi:ribose transport system substrate-binding protein
MITIRRILVTVGATALLASSFAGITQAQSPGVNEAATSVDFEWGTFTLAQRIVDKAARGEPLNIVVNNQGTAIPVFGAEQQIGTDRGCEDNGDRGLAIQCRLTGPASTDQAAQLAELETLLTTEQVDCLGSQSITPDAYVDIINRYVDAGIPVFTQNTDVPNSKRFAFFALNERDAGRVSGRTTAELVQDQGLDITGVAMGSGGPTNPWAKDRMGGFEEGYKETFPDAVFKQDENSGIPTGEGYTTQEVISTVGPYLTANTDVNLFFHTDQGVEGVGIVIRDSGATGTKWASGFNVSLPLLDLIDQDIILATINQGFDNQAEAAVRACVDFLLDGVLPPDPLAYLDPIVITKDGGEGRQSAADARAHLEEVLGGGGASPAPSPAAS